MFLQRFGREVGWLAHSQPLLTFELLVNQIQQYSNMIEPVVDFLAFLSPLSRDAAVVVLLESLSSRARSARKADGTNLAEWLAALASFIGQLFRKYKDLDLLPVLECVRNKLLDESTLELVVLEELFIRMSGIDANQAGMSEKQLAGQCGSATLRSALRPVPIEGSVTRSTARLRQALEKSGLVSEFFILINQVGMKTAIFGPESEEMSLKMLGDSYDKARGCWMQLCYFVDQMMPDRKVLSEKLPSLSDLVYVHKFSLGEALVVLR